MHVRALPSTEPTAACAAPAVGRSVMLLLESSAGRSFASPGAALGAGLGAALPSSSRTIFSATTLPGAGAGDDAFSPAGLGFVSPRGAVSRGRLGSEVG